jgi:hypothetical protein
MEFESLVLSGKRREAKERIHLVEPDGPARRCAGDAPIAEPAAVAIEKRDGGRRLIEEPLRQRSEARREQRGRERGEEGKGDDAPHRFLSIRTVRGALVP